MSPIRFLIAVAIMAIVAIVPTADAQRGRDGHARVELISDRAVAIPGETVWLGLSFEIDPNWHIYWKNAGDAGIPPSIVWSETSGIDPSTIGEINWPVPELLPVLPGEIMDYGYSNQVVLPFAVTIPENARGVIRLEGITNYLICEDICIPESADLQLALSIGTAQVPDQRGAELINQGLERGPALFEGDAQVTQQGETWILSVAGSQFAGQRGEARFFPEGHEIVHAADQPVSFGARGLQITLTPSPPDAAAPDTLNGIVQIGDLAVDIEAVAGTILADTSGQAGINLLSLIVLALIGGLILNLMPCVLPVLSIKAIGVVGAAASGNAAEVRKHGIWYTIGVLLSFAILAAAIVAVRAATGIATWGFWMQSPVIITVLVLVLFLLGLWLLGMFELGTSVQNVGDGLARKQGSAGAFFTGVLAVVVGAPCTGPFLGAALGGIMGQPALYIFVVLMAMGLGLALPFLVLSFVTSLQKKMPKPGAWMETLKQVFAFPMFLTAAYFLWTLGDLAGTITVAVLVAGAALIAFGIWALKQDGTGGRAIWLSLLGIGAIVPIFGVFSALSAGSGLEVGISLAWLGLVVGLFYAAAKASDQQLSLATKLLAIVAVIWGLSAPVMQARRGVPATSVASYSTNYPTEAWSPARVAELTGQGRAVFVDFTATWCVNCQANKRRTLKTAAVTDAFKRGNVAFLVADFTRPNAEIAAELKRHNRAGVPMYLWYAAGETSPVILPEILSVSLVTGLIE